MTVRFKRLLTVHVSHGYYGGLCEAMDYVTPADTAGRMRAGRLLARRIGGSLGIFYEADDAGAPRVSLGGQFLRFGLLPVGPVFFNVTELPGAPGGGVPLYRNAPDARALAAPTSVVLTGRMVRHSLSSAARPVTVSVRGPQGTALVKDEDVAEGDGRSIVSFDLGGADTGPFTVLELRDGSTVETPGYLDPELQAQAVVGLLDLAIAPKFYEAPPEFTIEYAARRDSSGTTSSRTTTRRGTSRVLPSWTRDSKRRSAPGWRALASEAATCADALRRSLDVDEE